jgi:signal transduction histidine kinase
MSEAAWPHRVLPHPHSAASAAWTGEVPTPAELATLRRRLRVAVAEGLAPPATDDDDVERLVLAFDELVSNALRHGRPPARVAVTATGTGWLIDVSDTAVELPPAPPPATGLDPAGGGLGLYLVARLGAAHGWLVEEDRKHVWAHIMCTAHSPADGVAGRLRAMALELTSPLPVRPAIRVAGPLDELREDMVTDLFAVLHEALTNVVRHARASTARVDIEMASGTVALEVADDGAGMAGAPRDGGLADLRRRATWHGGTLSVDERASGGTLLSWCVPVSRRPGRPGSKAGTGIAPEP